MNAPILIMNFVRLILLVLASVFAIKVANQLLHIKNKKPIYQIKKSTFTFLSAGVVLYTIGLVMLQIFEFMRITKFPTVADIPIALSQLCITTGFIIFWIRSSFLHKLELKEPIFFSGVVFAVMIWLVFLFKVCVVNSTYFLTTFLYWYYPIMTALMFVSTLIINPRLKAAIITTPLWYLSTAVFLNFLAFNIQYYSIWTGFSGLIPSIYSLLYVFSAGFFVIGFYVASQNYK